MKLSVTKRELQVELVKIFGR